MSRKELSEIKGGDSSTGNQANCWSDTQCAPGNVCQLNDDGNPGQCVSGGSSGNAGGHGCGRVITVLSADGMSDYSYWINTCIGEQNT